MNRNQKTVYCFIYDENRYFYRANQSVNGSWAVAKNSQMYPLRHNPKNLHDCPIEFSTNKKYFSMARSVNYPLEFILDGAAILNYIYLNQKGFNSLAYLAIVQFDPNDGIYRISYNGRFDFQQKERDEKLGTFKVPTVDDSAWGILSQNDDVQYSIDCSANNPKAIRTLFDNFTLTGRYTYQTVSAAFLMSAAGSESPYSVHEYAIPFININSDGDAIGIISRNENLEDIPQGQEAAYIQNSTNYFFSTAYQLNNIIIQGSISFLVTTPASAHVGFCEIDILFKTSVGVITNLFNTGLLIIGQKYKFDYNLNINAAPSEKFFIVFRFTNHFHGEISTVTILPDIVNTYISVVTKNQPVVCYGLRPKDLLEELVNKGTLGRYTMDSDFFEVNNKTVIIPGESLRQLKDSKITSSFDDFFKTFDSLFFMALRNINGNMFMERSDEIYKNSGVIIDLGEITEMKTSPAIEYFPNQIEVGSPKQDYRHSNGRLEFNAPVLWSLPFFNVKNKLSLLTKYRTDPFGIIFIIIDYFGGSTKDDSGDGSNFVVDITDEQWSALEDIETFENVTVDNMPLSPIIKSPLTGEIIYYNKPVIKGIGVPGNNVSIYVNGVLDGSTVVGADTNWSYQIQNSIPSYNPGVFDGVAVIQASFTDLSAANDSIQLIINTTVPGPTNIIYPSNNDSLYNNLPLIKGVAPRGTNINLMLDGALLAALVADNSCKFEFKVVVPLTNGNHVISVGTQNVNIIVDSFVSFPLITYIGSELDGFPIFNNLPLIKGVAIPGTIVSIWLDYLPYSTLGTVLTDANGDWSFQTIPINYIDPVTGNPVVLSPIKNGLNIISTSLINQIVKVNVTGYKLNRPNYNSITGVPDNTVFNTRLSPKRMLLNHKSLLSGIMNKQKGDLITFERHDKNPNLRTILGTEVISERENISQLTLGSPISLFEKASIKIVAKKNYNETLYDFNNGGIIKGKFNGKDVYFLPIGNMKMKSIMDDVQEWELLISSITTYSDLLSLFKNGTNINLMQNSLYHSDHNSLHMVEYGKPESEKYYFKSIYDDWFNNRNDAWITNPSFIQKFQKSETITDQIIVSSGLGAVILRMYRCSDAKLIQTFNYNAVNPAPIPLPEIVKEAIINFRLYPEDQYFLVMCINVERLDGNHSEDGNLSTLNFTGTPIPGDDISVHLTYLGVDKTFHYTTVLGDSLQDVMNKLSAIIDADVSFLSSAPSSSSILVDTGGGDFILVDLVITLSADDVLPVCISERIETKIRWIRTILLESSNSLNRPGIFYSTGFKTILRIEGLIKKLQPSIDTVIAKEQDGDGKTIWSNVSKKRVVRLGKANNVPDYMAIKLALAIVNDECLIEGALYSLEDGEKMNPSEDVEGYPMYHYDVNMIVQENAKGKVFPGGTGADIGGVVIVVDAAAIGLPGQSLINIEED